jgi:hypothetical protein
MSMRQAESIALIVTFLAASIAATACEARCGLLNLPHNSTEGSTFSEPASCCPENPMAPAKHSSSSGASEHCAGKAFRGSAWFLARDLRMAIPIPVASTEQMHTEALTIAAVFAELLLPPLLAGSFPAAAGSLPLRI